MEVLVRIRQETLPGLLVVALLLAVGLGVSRSTFASQLPPPRVISARSVYLSEDKVEQGLLNAASQQFQNWGRFSTVSSSDKADLLVRFSHKNGMDRWGNVGFVVMDVFLPGDTKPTFESKSALHMIFNSQHRTLACIEDFRKWLEKRH